MLEVAPNMGTTAIEVASRYGCRVTGVDLHAPSLDKAKENVRQHGLEEQVRLVIGNAMALPFPDNSFDVVINEAMLTMLTYEQKQQAVSEYLRVLKPGGRLATHDLLLQQEPDTETVKQRLNELRKAIYVNAQPMTAAKWEEPVSTSGFWRSGLRHGQHVPVVFEGADCRRRLGRHDPHPVQCDAKRRRPAAPVPPNKLV